MAEAEKHGEHAHIRCRAIIEVLGKPKEYVEDAIKQYISHIKEDSELVILNEDYSETAEIEKTKITNTEQIEKNKADSLMADDAPVNEDGSQKDKKMSGLWSKFVELELVIKGTKKLVGFCFEYMPSSLEVLKPEHLVLTNQEISSFLNDLQARLHNVDMIVKQLKAENGFLKLNMNAVLHNAILICLKVSKLDLEQLSQVTGVDKKELEIFAEKMVKENKIKKEDDIYTLA